MNKEQVEKHGDVIKWFCNNPEKGVWIMSKRDCWKLDYKPVFGTMWTIVQNDEYAELRKAQADGKIIQYILPRGGALEHCEEYSNLDCKFTGHIGYYRIKSDESKFKIGDWLTDIKGIDREKNTNFLVSSIMVRYKADDVKLWKPEQGKLCCFYDEVSDEIKIEAFSDEDDGLYYGQYSGESFANVAPLELVQHLEG